MVSQTGLKFASSWGIVSDDFSLCHQIGSNNWNLLFVIHRVFTAIVFLLRSFFWLFPSLYLYMCFLEVQDFEFHVAIFAPRSVIFQDHFNRIEISEVFWTTHGLVPSMNELSFTSCKSLLKTLNRVQDNHLHFCMKCLVRCWGLMFKWFIKYCW